MISLKHFAALSATVLMVVSCSPYPPEAGTVIQTGPDLAKIRAQNAAAQSAEAKAKALADAKAKTAAEKRREIAEKAAERRKEIDKAKTTFNAPYRPPVERRPVRKKPKYPTAKKIPGKPGYVFNPYTYEPVDVRGIPGGSLVVDPNDPSKSSHKFRVP